MQSGNQSVFHLQVHRSQQLNPAPESDIAHRPLCFGSTTPTRTALFDPRNSTCIVKTTGELMMESPAPSEKHPVSYLAASWQRPEILEAIFDQITDALFLYDKSLH